MAGAAVRSASVKVKDEGDRRFVVQGPITFATARRTCAAGIAAFAGSQGDIVVDCAGVAPADSAGVAVLIEWRRWAKGQGRALGFANLPPAVQGIVALSGLESVLADPA